jgi:hypothetical protein
MLKTGGIIAATDAIHRELLQTLKAVRKPPDRSRYRHKIPADIAINTGSADMPPSEHTARCGPALLPSAAPVPYCRATKGR